MYIIDHNAGKGIYECRYENFCRATPFLDDGMLFAISSIMAEACKKGPYTCLKVRKQFSVMTFKKTAT